ncbi:DREPP family [Parasponia andersonii]|uniref:DREPP family n=1 Tax=Parasponia andersonii TaxID=3476 RepID=A0A2P5B7B0_PARAD|nr:DREPP family [Parasponia andersonii]
MGYWKTKVLPKIKKVFEKNGAKKAAAAEATKSFDESKDEINKEFEEKKVELQPKVVGVYEASSAEIRTLVKEPKETGIKKNSVAVHKFLEELVKIEFPGSKTVTEASSKYGPGLVSGPVIFVFEKVSTLVVKEEVKVEEGATSSKEKEIAIEEEKKEEKEEGTNTDQVVAEQDKPAEVAAEEPPKKAEEEAVEPPKQP